jgi:hypothetical protein
MRPHVTIHRRFLLALALVFLLPHLGLALTPSQVYERVKDSIVVVRAYDRTGKQVGLGSGVVLPSGDIVTNHHVIKAGVRHTVARGGETAAATVMAFDPDKDLCLLLAPRLIATPARLGRATALKVGEKVYAVGAPAGLELSLSEGIVSQLRGGPPPIIQTTVAISPGSSGGALFNERGELVGITTFCLGEGQSLNFALPVEWLTMAAWVEIDPFAAIREKYEKSDKRKAPDVPKPEEKVVIEPYYRMREKEPVVGHKAGNVGFSSPISAEDATYIGLAEPGPFALKDIKADFVMVESMNTT